MRMIIGIMSSNSCPRCGGNLAVGNDQFGAYLQCLMCNRSTDLNETQGKTVHTPNPVLSASTLMGELKQA